MKKYIWCLFFVSFVHYTEAQTLTITIEHLRNNEGEVSLTIYDSKDTWLNEALTENKHAFSKKSIEKGVLLISLELGKPGPYAFAVLDDEDANGKMRHNLIGYPREGFGFSKNPRIRFSKPKFDECMVNIQNDTTIRISMQYK